MAKSGLKHIDVGSELSKSEWESEESHELVHGNSFPGSPVERQLYYRDDEHKWYVYNGSAWVWLGGDGGGGSGDMLKSVYDTNDDGVVDNSEKLEGSTKSQVQDHAPKAHKTSHENGGGDEISIAGLSGDPAHTINKSLLTARGDIIYRDASAPARLAKGIPGTALLMGANDPGWSSPPLFSIANKTYYIDSVDGDDSNSGESAEDAWETWAKAETMIPVFILHDYLVISLDDLPEGLMLEGRTTVSGGSLIVKGDKETTPYYSVNSIDVLSCFGDIRIQYFRTTTDRTFIGYSMLPRLDGIRFIHHDAASTSRAFDLEACIMGLRDCNVGTNKAQDGVFATNCRLVSHDNSGNATRYGIYANNSAVVAKRDTQPTGSTANEYTAFGGVIR